MTKRQRVFEIEDWGRIIDQICDILVDDTKTIIERLKICEKTKRRMVGFWLKSSKHFECIWRMRWERINRYEEGLNFALSLDIMACPL